MKVIKNGEEIDSWKLRINCTGRGNGGGGCGALLEIREEDIYNTYSYDYLGDKDTYYTIVCPICGKETDLNTNQLPYEIQYTRRGVNKETLLKRYLSDRTISR